MSILDKRVEGQIWIDRLSPYNLRYFVNNTEFTVKTAASYTFSNEAPVTAGQVVKLNSKNELAPAVFPEDLEKVIGVVASTPDLQNDTDNKAEISQFDYIEVPADSGVFMPTDLQLTSDIEENKVEPNNGYTVTNIIGAPVYWFIGNKDIYSTEDLTNNAGKLTLATPSGYASNPETIIEYNNLPQIGNVVGIEQKNGKITLFKIHLHFAKFDSSIEWSYPKKDAEALIKNEENVILIKHGLFPDTSNTSIENFTDTLITENGKKINCIFPVENITTGDNASRGTSVSLKVNKDNVKFRIHGQVTYINKGVQA